MWPRHPTKRALTAIGPEERAPAERTSMRMNATALRSLVKNKTRLGLAVSLHCPLHVQRVWYHSRLPQAEGDAPQQHIELIQHRCVASKRAAENSSEARDPAACDACTLSVATCGLSTLPRSCREIALSHTEVRKHELLTRKAWC
jgi:hypothetical protein